jgi:hypothetical protein
MKKWIVLFLLFAVGAAASGFVYTRLLSEEDLEFQRINNENGVALGSLLQSEHPWGSYNQWQCFSLESVTFDCVIYDVDTLVPSISFESEDEVLYFDTYVEDRLQCQETLNHWQELAEGGDEICIFAAHMPDVDWAPDHDKPQSLWYINRLKGAGGYWNLYESSPAYNQSLDPEEAQSSQR